MSTKSKKMTTSAKHGRRMTISECPMCLIHAKGDKATQAEITRLRNEVAHLEGIIRAAAEARSTS